MKHSNPDNYPGHTYRDQKPDSQAMKTPSVTDQKDPNPPACAAGKHAGKHRVADPNQTKGAPEGQYKGT